VNILRFLFTLPTSSRQEQKKAIKDGIVNGVDGIVVFFYFLLGGKKSVKKPQAYYK
jgi:hypothetical protein